MVNDYTAAPVYFGDHSNGAHEWLIEFEKEPENYAGFAAELDKALKELNSDYEAKRHKDIALRTAGCKISSQRTFHQLAAQKRKTRRTT